MRRSYDFCRLNRAIQVTGHHSINLLISQPPGHLFSLFPTLVVQTALRLSLHDLASIVNGLAMTHQKNCCIHWCKITKIFVYLQTKTIRRKQ